jgi:hypothetical protein
VTWMRIAVPPIDQRLSDQRICLISERSRQTYAHWTQVRETSLGARCLAGFGVYPMRVRQPAGKPMLICIS